MPRSNKESICYLYDRFNGRKSYIEYDGLDVALNESLTQVP
jgi:hypothetical protein